MSNDMFIMGISVAWSILHYDNIVVPVNKDTFDKNLQLAN